MGERAAAVVAIAVVIVLKVVITAITARRSREALRRRKEKKRLEEEAAKKKMMTLERTPRPKSETPTTLDRVCHVIKDRMGHRLALTKEEIYETDDIQDDLGLDSLDVIDLVIGAEDEFEIQIPDEEADRLRTVKQIVEYVDSKRTEAIS